MSKDLFGNEIKDISLKKFVGKYEVFRARYNYRESTNEESCKNCQACRRMEYHDRVYYKCLQQGVSNSSSSDIRLKMVCDLFKKEVESDNKSKL